jgi:subtilisin family serine protease
MPRSIFPLLLVAAVLATPSTSRTAATERQHGAATEVVVRLAGAPVSRGGDPAGIARAQASFQRSLVRLVPDAHVRWRYRLVLDGVAVTLPAREVDRLARLPGVAEVFRSVSYRAAAAGPAVDQIGAPQLWAPGLQNAGDGIKIGIIDDGIDRRHPFFDPTGYVTPPGFPKGQRAFTSAKVIVARAFAAPGQTGSARAPFIPSESHGTHVAGIAAGDPGTNALGAVVSGVAPHAYIGNYRALTVPTDGGVGHDGNAPELVAAIEAAVADGMNVINLSVGQPEIEPSRDVVALALDGAAAAGVVPVVSAGNDLEEFGAGSVSSPGASAGAITVAAVSTVKDGPPNVVAYFSSAGPTPLSLRLKPDVSAPGTEVLSSVPGGWGTLSGTSMAAPHVSGAAALLLQRHPDWTVAEIKAALVETARDVWTDDDHTIRAGPTREGGGIVDLPHADDPLVFTSPSSVSFGLVRAGTRAAAAVNVDDAGGGSGPWTVAIRASSRRGTTVSTASTVDVPGTLSLSVRSTGAAAQGDVAGFIVLQRGTVTRRIPFWLRVIRPRLGRHQVTRLTSRGTYRGDTSGARNLVSTYRYPELQGVDGALVLAGPEQVFRVALRHPVANFGVAVVSRGPGVKVEPRVVAEHDENRLTGNAALPVVLNPYLADFEDRVLAAGALDPTAGTYDIVFDSRSRDGAGRFTFRYWVNDVTPPTASIAARTVRAGTALLVHVADAGSGVDPDTIVVRVDGKQRQATFADGVAQIDTKRLSAGRHRLTFQVSDYQETRNTENVAAILPNTRRLNATVTITR